MSSTAEHYPGAAEPVLPEPPVVEQPSKQMASKEKEEASGEQVYIRSGVISSKYTILLAKAMVMHQRRGGDLHFAVHSRPGFSLENFQLHCREPPRVAPQRTCERWQAPHHPSKSKPAQPR